MSQPEFASSVDPTQAGLINRREARNPLGVQLTQPGRSYRSQVMVLPNILRGSGDLGTQPGLHDTSRSHDAPKFSNNAGNIALPARPVNPRSASATRCPAAS